MKKVIRKLKSCDEDTRSEEHTSELQSHSDLVCRLLLEKKKKIKIKKKKKIHKKLTTKPRAHNVDITHYTAQSHHT